MASEFPGSDPVDFFVSRNGADKAWAVWVAQTLKANGYTVMVQDWDFHAGQNFVLKMRDAADLADRTIGIISPDYLSAEFTQSEWAAAFVQDPEGRSGRFLPVVVRSATMPALLKPIIHIDLVGLDEAAATRELLTQLGGPGVKSPDEVPFPGTPSQSATTSSEGGRQAPASPKDEPVQWSVVENPSDVRWVKVSSGPHMAASGSHLEVHLVPTASQRVEVRRLARLGDELIGVGRQSGLFSPQAAVIPAHDAESASAESLAESRYTSGPSSGIMITRTGQRSAWLPMPADSMGPVFDPGHLTDRVTELLRLLSELPNPLAAEYALAAAITSPMMLTTGDVSVLNHRNSASGLRTNSSDILMPPDGAVPARAVTMHPAPIAEEIVARLAAAL